MPQAQPSTGRGYYGIGIWHGKTPMNVGTLWRSAQNFGAAFIFTIGQRYARQASDTLKTPLHIPLYQYVDFDDMHAHLPWSCPIVGIEQMPGKSVALDGFRHPERALYLLGAEDHGLPSVVAERCHFLVEIDTPRCLNVAVAGSIVLYSRQVQRTKVRSAAA